MLLTCVERDSMDLTGRPGISGRLGPKLTINFSSVISLYHIQKYGKAMLGE